MIEVNIPTAEEQREFVNANKKIFIEKQEAASQRIIQTMVNRCEKLLKEADRKVVYNASFCASDFCVSDLIIIDDSILKTCVQEVVEILDELNYIITDIKSYYSVLPSTEIVAIVFKLPEEK